MGYVTVTESEYVGEVSKTTSITFECFEDFLDYDKQTREDVKLEEPKAPLTKFEVGKEYRVIGNSNGHGFKIGEVIRLISSFDSGGECRAEYLDGSDYWYMVAEDLEEI